MAILEVAQLEKSFGGTKVLRDISFSLEEGQALSIIGSSGSGKTTLLRCLNFLETPDSGRIAVRGRNLLDGSLSPQERRRNRLHFGLVFQDFNLFPQYTALENVTLARRLLASGYTRGSLVEGVGQFAMRGGIVDVFSPASDAPVRIEFFGDEVDTMGQFDAQTQRRTENLEALTILPVAECLPQLHPGVLGGRRFVFGI